MGAGALLAGGGGLGAGLGAAAGAMDSPDTNSSNSGNSTNRSTTSNTSTQQTQFGPLSDQERQLQQYSLQNYLSQLGLQNQNESQIASGQPLQDAARSNALGIINGSAFNLTPQEQQAIETQRQNTIAQSGSDIGKFLDQRTAQLNEQAGMQGIRGQALYQNQGDATRSAADQYANNVRAANVTASNQTMNTPYQRMQAQAPYINSGLSFADQLRQNAENNRQVLQNPYLLGLSQQERLQSGTTTNTQNGTGFTQQGYNGMQTQYGEQGSLRNAILGGISGGAAGANAASGFAP